MSMKTITASAAKSLGRFLAKDFRQIFGSTHDETAERLSALARSTLECLGRSDALYHNLEHTYLVTMVGRDILQGFSLSHRIEPSDYSHLICACLLHDIGYVRGILSGDTETEFVIDQNETKITLPRGASDAALMPYHVERSKMFAIERLGSSPFNADSRWDRVNHCAGAAILVSAQQKAHRSHFVQRGSWDRGDRTGAVS